MNENTLTILGYVIAVVAALPTLWIVFQLLKVVAGLTWHAVSQTVRALWRLLFGMVFDIRFLNMLAVIFCLLAERRASSHWPWMAFTVSISAFVIAAMYIGLFLVTNSGLARSPAASSRLGVAIHNVVHQFRLNIGFLGLIYLSISFSSLGFSYHLLSISTELFAHKFIILEGQGSYGDFFSFTAGAMVDSVPSAIKEHFQWRISSIQAPPESTLIWGVVWFFRICFCGALWALFCALLRPRLVHPDDMD